MTNKSCTQKVSSTPPFTIYDSLTTKQKKVRKWEMTVLESILYCIGMVSLIVLFSSI